MLFYDVFSVARILDETKGPDGEERGIIGGLSGVKIRQNYELKPKPVDARIGNHVEISVRDGMAYLPREEMDSSLDDAIASATANKEQFQPRVGSALPKIEGSVRSVNSIGGSLSTMNSDSQRPTSPYYKEDLYKSMFPSASAIEADKEIDTTVAGIMIPIKQKKISGAAAAAKKASHSLTVTGEMRRVRQAEMVLLKEEERHGRYSKDSEGRLVPIVIAKTRKLVLELCKDDRRSVDQPAHTASTLAPHAIPSGIGVLDEGALLALEEARNSTQGKGEEDDIPDVLKRTDFESNARVRGQDKIGGMLSPIETKAADSRARRPIRPNLSGSIESNRYRKKQVLTDKLASIEVLRKALVAQRKALEKYNTSTQSMASKERQSSTYGDDNSTYSRSRSQGSMHGQGNIPSHRSRSEKHSEHSILVGADSHSPSPSPHSHSLPLSPALSPSPSFNLANPSQSHNRLESSLADRIALSADLNQHSNSSKPVSDSQVQRSPRMLSEALAASRSYSVSSLPPALIPPASNDPKNDPMAQITPTNHSQSLLNEILGSNIGMGPLSRAVVRPNPTHGIGAGVPLGKIMSEEELVLRAKEAALKSESRGLKQQLTYIERFDKEFSALKVEERRRVTVDKARELERKRRMLTKEEGRLGVRIRIAVFPLRTVLVR
jgi:hypothetical protein